MQLVHSQSLLAAASEAIPCLSQRPASEAIPCLSLRPASEAIPYLSQRLATEAIPSLTAPHVMYPLQLTAEAIYTRNVSLLFVAGFFLSLAKPQVRGDMGEILDQEALSILFPFLKTQIAQEEGVQESKHSCLVSLSWHFLLP